MSPFATVLLWLLVIAVIGAVTVGVILRRIARVPGALEALLEADRKMIREHGDGRVTSEDHGIDRGLSEDFNTPGLYPPGLNEEAEASEIKWETLRGEAHPLREEDKES